MRGMRWQSEDLEATTRLGQRRSEAALRATATAALWKRRHWPWLADRTLTPAAAVSARVISTRLGKHAPANRQPTPGAGFRPPTPTASPANR